MCCYPNNAIGTSQKCVRESEIQRSQRELLVCAGDQTFSGYLVHWLAKGPGIPVTGKKNLIHARNVSKIQVY